MADRTCPSREQIAAYLENALDSLASERLAAHVETCQDCQATLQTLCDVDDTLLEQLRAPLVDSPFVRESRCERAVARAASEASRSVTANDAGAGAPAEWPAVLAQLREYQVLGFVKEGGMGSVYRAIQTRLGRTVAIKLLSKQRTSDPKARARFEREIQLVGKLRHENIVQAYDAREIDGTLLLVMEFLEGMSLGDILRNLGALPIADACELVRQAALGLSHAHTQGLIHRDVKPSNLMLDEHGQVKVLDLGLARLRTDDATSGETTSSGQLMGTADYIAPEQINDAHEVDARADIYSLGCTLYALLTGRAPFEGLGRQGSHVAKMMAHLEKEPTPVRDVRADVPAKVAMLLQRMLAKDPENRLATAAEVADALRPFCAEADLPALLSRARAKDAEEERPAGPTVVPPHGGDADALQSTSQRRRLAWTVLVATATLFFIVALGIVIRIRYKDGSEAVVRVPDDAQVVIESDDSSTAPAAARPSTDVAKPSEVPAGGAASPVVQSGEPLSTRALTMQPAPLPGVQSWTLETPVHRGPINSVAYSPDGKTVATGGEDSTVRVWDSTSAELLRVLHGHNGLVWKVAWSHNGNLLASASADGTVRVWDPATGQLLHVLKGHEGAVRAVAWSPDDAQIVTGGADKTLRFRDASTGRPNAVMPMSAAISCLTWLPDGKTVVVADDQKTVQFIEAATKTAVRTLTHDEVVSDVALTADGQRLVTADMAGSVYVWEIATGTRLLAEAKLSVAGENATERHSAWVAFSPDGKHLAAGGACRTVRVWEISSGLLAFEFKGHTDIIRNLAWSPDGLTVVTVCDPADGSMRFWNVGDGNAQAVVDGYRPTPMIPLGWSLDGNTIAYRRGDGSDWFLDTRLDKPVVRAFDQPSICGWSSSGECVLSGSAYGDLAAQFPNGPAMKALRLDTILKNVPVEPTEEAALHAAEFSSDFRLAAVPYYRGNPTETVRVISLESGDVLHVLKTGNIGRMSLSRDGSTLVTNPYDDKDPRLLVWDTHSGELRHTITNARLNRLNSEGFWSVAASADGSKLALEFAFGVLVVDVATQQGLKYFDNKGLGTGQPESIPFAWLPDDNQLIALAYAPTAANAGYWLYDFEAGVKTDLPLPGLTGVVYTDGLPVFGGGLLASGGAVAASPQSQFVAGSIGIHVLPVWETKTGGVHSMLLTYGCQEQPIHFAMDAAGDYAWLSEGQDGMVIVVATDHGQQLLTPDQFSQRYGWQNDPEKLRVSSEHGATPPATTSPSTSATADGVAAQNQAEPAVVKPGERISATALTIAPAPIPGIQAWTIDTPSHRGLINSISFSPDGKTVATAGDDGTVRLWSAGNMQLLRTLYGHNHSVWKVTWSHDGTRLASASEDGTIRVWEAGTGRTLKILPAHQSVMRSMAWSPDNAQFATAGPDKKLCLLDAHSGQVIDAIPMSDAAVACAWSVDGRSLAVANDQKTIQLVDVRTHSTLSTLPADETVYDVQFSSDGQHLAAVDTAGTVYLWDVATGQRLLADTRMSVAGDDPNARHPAWVAFSPDGKHLAAGGACRTVRVWEVGSAKMTCELTGHTDMIRALAWSPNGQAILTAAGQADNGMRVWDAATGTTAVTIESFRSPPTSYASAWSPDGRVLITSWSGLYLGLGFGPVQFWDMAFTKPTESFETAGSPVRYLWTPDGELVLIDAPDAIPAAFQGKTFRKASLANAASSIALEPGEEPVLREAVFSRDGTLAAVAYLKTNHIRIFSTVSQELLMTLKGHTKPVRGLAFHPDNKRLVSTSFEDLTMRHWDVTTGEQTQLIDTRWPGNEGTGFVAWSPDGERCAFSGLWCVGGLDTLLGYPHPSPYIIPTVWLPSGKKLVSMSLLFDCDKEKGTPLKSPYFSTAPSEEGFNVPSASPDSRFVAVPEGPNCNVIWDVESVKVHAALVTYQRGDQYDCLATNPAGHHAWLSPGKDPLVYTVLTDAGQETLTPVEFAQRFGWQNNPAQLQLSP